MHKNLFILDFILYLYKQGFIKWPTLRTRIYPCSIIALRMTLPTADLILQEYNHVFGSVVEWLKHRTDDQHGLGSKPTCAILLCPGERHFTAHFPAWCSWQTVLNYSNISTKLLADSNILATPEAGRGNCLPYV